MPSGYYRVHALLRAQIASTTERTREDFELDLFSFEQEKQAHDHRNPTFELVYYIKEYCEIHVSFQITYKDRDADINEYIDSLINEIESRLNVLVSDFEIEEIIPS